MTLNEKQKKYLRSLAHTRKPVVMIAEQGLKESVQDEIDQALRHHELIKIRINVGDRTVRDQMAEDICSSFKCNKIQRVGNILTVFKRNSKKPKIIFPK